MGMRFLAEVVVSLKPVVNDPQGLVVRAGLRQLGFAEVGDVRVGKHISLEVDAGDEGDARRRVAEMCERLLRNPVIEDYRIDLRAVVEPSSSPPAGPA
jgi:phosphoribosylformylglycinamidine synthase PurS subunit